MSNINLYRKEEAIRPEGALSFVIVSFTQEDIYYKVKETIKKTFSEILFESIQMTPWVPTPAEIGFSAQGNKARILAFKRRINREELPEIKQKLFRGIKLFLIQLLLLSLMIFINCICFTEFTLKLFINMRVGN